MPKVLLDLLDGLIEKMGATIAGVILMAAGAVWVLPYFGIPAYVAQGFGMFGLGVGVIAFGKRAKKASDMMVTNEAQKRIENQRVPDTSAVPAIQNEIAKMKRDTANGTNLATPQNGK